MIFNDYDYKDLTYRVRVKMLRKEEKPLNTWELSNFINNFSTYYYKYEIIETIAIALNQGIDPKNILIFSTSFSLNNVYSKFDTIYLSDDRIQYLPSLGTMISIVPNEKLINLNFILEAYNNLKEIYKEIKKYQSIPYDYIVSCYNNIKELSVNEELDNLEFMTNHINAKIENDNLPKKVEEVFGRIRKEYSYYQRSKIKLKSVTKLLCYQHQMSLFDNIYIEDFKKEENDLFENYFKRFFTTLSRLPRPVVAIYHEDENAIKILCKAHINKDKTNVTSLDLKSFTHNSPSAMEYTAGQFISKGIDYVLSSNERNLKKQLLEEQIKTEKLKQQTEIEKQKNEKLDQLNKQIDILEKLNDINKLNIPNNIKMVNSSYLKSELNNLENKLGGSLQQLLARNRFDLIDENVEKMHIDTYK